MEPRFGHNFSWVRVHIDVPKTIQTKLIIGQPNDRYEQEADRVADEVMRMPEPQVQRQVEPEEEEEEELIQTKPIAEEITPLIQKQPIEEEEPIEGLEEEEEPIMTKALSYGAPQVTDGLRALLNRSKGGGQKLPETYGDFMEKRFGVDFSGVRIHTDSNAVQMNRDLSAQAFTHGRDIYFGAGRYSPSTSSGERLLAHELTHVVQQTSNDIPGVPTIQCDVEDDLAQGLGAVFRQNYLENPVFRTGEHVRERSRAAIPNISEIQQVAISYGLNAADLVAFFISEGGMFGTNPYSSATHLPQAARVSFHLWNTHGMDDFSVVVPAGGQLDNSFASVLAQRHMGRLRNRLHLFRGAGLLWDGNVPWNPSPGPLRATDWSDQVTVNDAVTLLLSEGARGVPTQLFRRIVYRLAAATIAHRQIGPYHIRQLRLLTPVLVILPGV
jgi:hypothetical protein